MLKRILASTFAIILLIPMLTLTISAEPFKDIKIMDGVTTIEADWFDSGVYEEQNADEGDHTSRPDEAPQTQQTAGYSGRDGVDEDNNYCIGWIYNGEWIQYTVNVDTDGSYKFQVWLATDVGDQDGLELYYDEATKIGFTGEIEQEGWQTYAIYNVGTIDMTAGTHVIKCFFLGQQNLDAIIVTRLGDPGTKEPPPPWVAPDTKIGMTKTTIKATDFDAGADNYSVIQSGNHDIRLDEAVNTEVGESEFGGNIGWISEGDWVQYSVKVNTDGIYKFDAWLASDADPTGGVKVYIDNKEIGTSPDSAKDGWQAYALYPVADETELLAGDHVIKVEFTGGCNFSALEINRVGNIVVETEAPTTIAEDATADDGADNTTAAGDTTSSDSTESSNNNMIIWIIIAAVVVVIIVVIIILVTRKKK